MQNLAVIPLCLCALAHAQCRELVVEPFDGFPGTTGDAAGVVTWDPDGAGPARSVLVVGGISGAGNRQYQHFATFDGSSFAQLPGEWQGEVTGLRVHAGDLYAVRELAGAASVWRYTSGAWQLAAGWSGPVPRSIRLLSNGADLLAVGASTTIPNAGEVRRLDGGAWALVTPVVAERFVTVHNGALYNINGGGHLERFEGGAWVQQTNESFGLYLQSLCSHNGNLYLLGQWEVPGPPVGYALMRLVGGAWQTERSQGGVVVFPISLINVPGEMLVNWSASYYSTIPLGSDGFELYGQTWGSPQPINYFINSGAELDGELYVCGYIGRIGGTPASGLLRRRNGIWEPVAPGIAASDLVLTANGDELVAQVRPGPEGLSPESVWARGADGWRELPGAPAPVYDGRVVAHAGSLYRNGSRWTGSSWEPLPFPPNGIAPVIKASVPGGVLALAGEVLYTWDGSVWTALPAVGTGLHMIDALSWQGRPIVIWSRNSTGRVGVSMRTSTAWVTIRAEAFGRPALRECGAHLVDEIHSSNLNYYDGAAWRPVPQNFGVPGFALTSFVTGTGVFAHGEVGDRRALLKWNGASWSMLTDALPRPYIGTVIENSDGVWIQDSFMSGEDGSLGWLGHLRPSACVADFDCTRGVDGDDIIAFFDLFNVSDPRADLDASGGVDHEDVIRFFEIWDRGC